MKNNFRDSILQNTDQELQTISKDMVFYSEEERLIALRELEKRDRLSAELIDLKKMITGKEYPVLAHVLTQRIYKKPMMWFGSLLGGPLVAGYFMAENFKAFNQTGYVKRTWIITILATLFIFGIVSLISHNVLLFPSNLIPIIYTLIAAAFIEKFQVQKIGSHFASDGEAFTWGRVIIFSIIGLTITSIATLCIAMLCELLIYGPYGFRELFFRAAIKYYHF